MMQLPGKLVNELLVILTQHQEFRLEVTCISDKLYALTIDTQMMQVNKLMDISRCMMASNRISSDF